MGRRSDWKSSDPFDHTAKRISIEGIKGVHKAFLRYSTDCLKPGQKGICSANVITMHTDLKPGDDVDMDVVRSIFEHEAQHVVQWYEVPDSDKRYDANPLYYEKEACARQLLYAPVDMNIKNGVVDQLAQTGMDVLDALIWMENVLLDRTYPGVNIPRADIIT